MCQNPKTVVDSKGYLSDNKETEDHEDEAPQEFQESERKRKEMEGTPPDKSTAQKPKEDTSLNDTVEAPVPLSV